MPVHVPTVSIKTVAHSNRNSMVMARTRTLVYDPTDLGMNGCLSMDRGEISPAS